MANVNLNDLPAFSYDEKTWDKFLSEVICRELNKTLIDREREIASSMKYISIRAACELLDVTKPTIYQFINEGLLTKYKMGASTRLLRAQVLELVKPVNI